MKTGELLLADRNRHVREFLRRELAADGYLVRVARDAQEILDILAGGEMPHLLILDLEIPFLAEVRLLEQLRNLYPSLPVLIYSFQPEDPQEFPMGPGVFFLEKAEGPHRLSVSLAALLPR